MDGYMIDLYYGYEEGNYGVSLDFIAVDPKVTVDSDDIANRLAESLDVAPDDYHFNYNSCSLELPESLIARIKEDAIKDYLAKGTFEKNSKIVYRYTDASNYHSRNEAVLHGVLTPERKQVILSCLNEGEFFIPGVVGLDVELPWEFDPQDDHPFWALDEDSFEETTRKPTVNITPEEFVRAFEENRDKWEQLGVEYVSQFEEEYDEKPLEEVLGDACLRASGSDKGSETVEKGLFE